MERVWLPPPPRHSNLKGFLDRVCKQWDMGTGHRSRGDTPFTKTFQRNEPAAGLTAGVLMICDNANARAAALVKFADNKSSSTQHLELVMKHQGK
jgi:hypothetical protein